MKWPSIKYHKNNKVTDNDYQNQRRVTFQNDMRYLRAVYTRLMMCDYRERGQLSVTSGITLIQINTETFPAFIAAPRADKLDS